MGDRLGFAMQRAGWRWEGSVKAFGHVTKWGIDWALQCRGRDGGGKEVLKLSVMSQNAI